MTGVIKFASTDALPEVQIARGGSTNDDVQVEIKTDSDTYVPVLVGNVPNNGDEKFAVNKKFLIDTLNDYVRQDNVEETLVTKELFDDQLVELFQEYSFESDAQVLIDMEITNFSDLGAEILTEEQDGKLTIDSTTVIEGDRVLVIAQSDPKTNGVYNLTLDSDTGKYGLARAGDELVKMVVVSEISDMRDLFVVDGGDGTLVFEGTNFVEGDLFNFTNVIDEEFETGIYRIMFDSDTGKYIADQGSGTYTGAILERIHIRVVSRSTFFKVTSGHGPQSKIGEVEIEFKELAMLNVHVGNGLSYGDTVRHIRIDDDYLNFTTNDGTKDLKVESGLLSVNSDETNIDNPDSGKFTLKQKSVSIESGSGLLSIKSTSQDQPLTIEADNGVQVNAHLVSTGTITGTELITSSDRNLKNSIVSLSSEDTHEKVLQLQGVQYKLNSDTLNQDYIGLIAQDVETHFPEFVRESNEHKSVNYSQMVAVLIESIKHQNSVIQSLEARVKALE